MNVNKSIICAALFTLLLIFPLYAQGNLSQQAGKYPPDTVYNTAKTKHIPMVMIFYAPWCAEGNQYLPLINELECVNGNKIIFLKVNVEDKQSEEIVKKYNGSNRYLPRTIIYNNVFQTTADFIGKKNKKEMEEYLKKL